MEQEQLGTAASLARADILSALQEIPNVEEKSYEQLLRIYQTFLLPLEQRNHPGHTSIQSSGQKLSVHKHGFDKISVRQSLTTTDNRLTERSLRASTRIHDHEEGHESAPENLTRQLLFETNGRFSSQKNSVPLKRHRSGYGSFHSTIERINGSNTENVKRLKIL